MDIFSFFTVNNILVFIFALSAFGLFYEITGVFPAKLNVFATSSSLATFYVVYTVFNQWSTPLSSLVFTVGVAAAAGVFFIAKTWLKTRQGTEKIVNSKSPSFVKKIERDFNRFDGFGTRHQREEYIQNVLSFLRGENNITWEALIKETFEKFPSAILHTDEKGQTHCPPDLLTRLFVNEIVKLSEKIVNEGLPSFMKIKANAEILKSQACYTYENYCPSESGVWLELHMDMNQFYYETFSSMVLLPMRAVRGTRLFIEKLITVLFAQSATLKLKHLC